MSFYVISCHLTFPTIIQKSREAGEGQDRVRVKYIFIGLRQQLLCQAEGKHVDTTDFLKYWPLASRFNKAASHVI
jgi:hypothetical protein